jgi:CBS domain-containing protein
VTGTVFAQADTPVGEMALRPALTVPLEAPISQAARAMRHHALSCVLVGEGGAIVTEKDLTRAVAEDRGPQTSCTDIATRAAKTVPADMALGKAAALMVRYGIRHLPVVAADGSIVGLLEMQAALRVLLRDAGLLVWLAELDGILADGG